MANENDKKGEKILRPTNEGEERTGVVSLHDEEGNKYEFGLMAYVPIGDDCLYGIFQNRKEAPGLPVGGLLVLEILDNDGWETSYRFMQDARTENEVFLGYFESFLDDDELPEDFREYVNKNIAELKKRIEELDG